MPIYFNLFSFKVHKYLSKAKCRRPHFQIGERSVCVSVLIQIKYARILRNNVLSSTYPYYTMHSYFMHVVNTSLQSFTNFAINCCQEINFSNQLQNFNTTLWRSLYFICAHYKYPDYCCLTLPCTLTYLSAFISFRFN